MNRKEKIVVVLFIVAMLFSVISIVINLGVFSFSDSKQISEKVLAESGKGSVNLLVEGNVINGEGQR